MSKSEVEEILQAPDEPMQDVEIGKRDTTSFRTPGFQRMRLDWSSDDRSVLNRAKDTAEGRLYREFPEVYRLLYRVYDVVRTAEVNPDTGEIMMDQWGLPRWQKDAVGSYLEDFSKLGIKEKEDILFTITTHLVEWQQLAADAWGEAMFAKAQWEERFSIGYDAPMSGTIEARTAAGRLDSRDERYFALFISLYSRKADALIRSLELLGQRIKDSMVG
jgi:hypothetical protein